MLHFVTSYTKQNKSHKQTLESAQYGLEISFNLFVIVVAGRYGFETFWRIHRINLNKVAGDGVG